MSEPSYARRKSNTVSEIIEGEAILINMDTGFYYSLSPSGSIVWELLEPGATATEIVRELAARYAGAPGAIAQATTEFLARLESEGLAQTLADAALPARAQPAARETRAPFEPPTLERYTDMQDFLLVDPIHEVTDEGWPNAKPSADGSP